MYVKKEEPIPVNKLFDLVTQTFESSNLLCDFD